MSVMSQQSMWPDGRESAACFTFDLDGEEVWIADLQAAGRLPLLDELIAATADSSVWVARADEVAAAAALNQADPERAR
jgi:hypothetical protein